jgi:hypothetical protein
MSGFDILAAILALRRRPVKISIVDALYNTANLKKKWLENVCNNI